VGLGLANQPGNPEKVPEAIEDVTTDATGAIPLGLRYTWAKVRFLVSFLVPVKPRMIIIAHYTTFGDSRHSYTMADASCVCCGDDGQQASCRDYSPTLRYNSAYVRII
jgi:hypothetical protein